MLERRWPPLDPFETAKDGGEIKRWPYLAVWTLVYFDDRHPPRLTSAGVGPRPGTSYPRRCMSGTPAARRRLRLLGNPALDRAGISLRAAQPESCSAASRRGSRRCRRSRRPRDSSDSARYGLTWRRQPLSSNRGAHRRSRCQPVDRTPPAHGRDNPATGVAGTPSLGWSRPPLCSYASS